MLSQIPALFSPFSLKMMTQHKCWFVALSFLPTCYCQISNSGPTECEFVRRAWCPVRQGHSPRGRGKLLDSLTVSHVRIWSLIPNDTCLQGLPSPQQGTAKATWENIYSSCFAGPKRSVHIHHSVHFLVSMCQPLITVRLPRLTWGGGGGARAEVREDCWIFRENRFSSTLRKLLRSQVAEGQQI